MHGIQPSLSSNNSSSNLTQILSTTQGTPADGGQELGSSQASEETTSIESESESLINMLTEVKKHFLGLAYGSEFFLDAQLEAGLGSRTLPKPTSRTVENVREYINGKIDKYIRLLKLQSALSGKTLTEKTLTEQTLAELRELKELTEQALIERKLTKQTEKSLTENLLTRAKTLIDDKQAEQALTDQTLAELTERQAAQAERGLPEHKLAELTEVLDKALSAQAQIKRTLTEKREKTEKSLTALAEERQTAQAELTLLEQRLTELTKWIEEIEQIKGLEQLAKELEQIAPTNKAPTNKAPTNTVLTDTSLTKQREKIELLVIEMLAKEQPGISDLLEYFTAFKERWHGEVEQQRATALQHRA